MKQQLDEWRQFWNFSVIYVFSGESIDADGARYGEEVHDGRLDFEFVREELKSFVRETDFVCISGTKSFDKDIIKYCLQMNIDETKMHKF